MNAPLLVVTGTGTAIGKTHLGVALVRLWGGRARVVGLKPVESGTFPGDPASDAARLAAVSTFHVKPPPPLPYTFARPVSPHLAARAERVAIDLAAITRFVRDVRSQAQGVLLELPGGLFSPLGPTALNADLARDLAPSAILLVAPDRLGVLHDIGAATHAATVVGIRLTGIALIAPATPDTSTATNAAEVPLVSGVPVLAEVPRAPAEDLAESPVIAGLLDRLLAPRA